MKFFTKKGFTLTELVIAVSISAIILIFIFNFVADIIGTLSYTKKKAWVFSSFYEFNAVIDNYKSSFPQINIFVNVSSNIWNDVIIFRNIQGTHGIMLWVVDKASMKLAKNSTYPFYTEKILWYRELTDANITEILWDANKIYEYKFFQDKVFDDLLVKSFQAEIYNTGAILDIDIYLNTDFSSELLWSEWSGLSQEWIYKINLNF